MNHGTKLISLCIHLNFNARSDWLKQRLYQRTDAWNLEEEATKRNEEKRSVLPHCHRQAGFKRLVQENPNGKEHHKHNHEKHEKELTA